MRIQTDLESAPMSLILAIMPGTRLRLRANGRWQILELQVGDVLIFRGDVLHNGLGYPGENMRMSTPTCTRRRTTMLARSTSLGQRCKRKKGGGGGTPPCVL